MLRHIHLLNYLTVVKGERHEVWNILISKFSPDSLIFRVLFHQYSSSPNPLLFHVLSCLSSSWFLQIYWLTSVVWITWIIRGAVHWVGISELQVRKIADPILAPSGQTHINSMRNGVKYNMLQGYTFVGLISLPKLSLHSLLGVKSTFVSRWSICRQNINIFVTYFFVVNGLEAANYLPRLCLGLLVHSVF